MKTKFLLCSGLAAMVVLVAGCGGGDSNDNSNNAGNRQAPLTLAGRTMTLTVGSTTFENSTNAAAATTTTASFSEATTVTTLRANDSGAGRKRHHERQGQKYMIHFADEHTCVIHHPETDDADETTTYVYNRDAQTVEIEGDEHEIEHLDFTSENDGHCHIEDDSGQSEDDDFVLS